MVMKKKLLITVLLYALAFFSNAQTGKVSIKFAPLALMDDISMPTIQGGMEVKLSNHFFWYNEVGIKYRKCVNELTDTSFIDSKGFKLKSEVRYYFNKTKIGIFKEPVAGLYLAGNLFYINDNHNTKINYYYKKDSSITLQDAFAVHKKVFGINLLGGFQHSIYKNFVIDMFAGIGIRIRVVNTENKEFNKDRDSLVQTIDFSVLSIRNYVDAAGGTSIVPSLTGGIRLCYNF